MRRHEKIILTLVLILTPLGFGLNSIARAQTSFVTIQGRDFIGPDHKPLSLKGINLGNWLLPEGYMFKFKSANSPRLIEGVINQLIGEDAARRFWKTYRDN